LSIVGLLTDESLQSSILQLEKLLTSEDLIKSTEIRDSIKLFFVMLHGVENRDVASVVKGFPLMAKFFGLPESVTIVLNIAALVMSSSTVEVDQAEYEKAFRDFGNAFKVNPTFVNAVVGLAKHDFEPVAKLAQRFGNVDSAVFPKIVSLLENSHNMVPKGIFSKSTERNENKKIDPNLAKNLDPSKLFDLFDTENKGSITFDQFTELVKYMNVDLSPTKAMKIFADSSSPKTNLMDKAGFEKALDALHGNIAGHVLDLMGLSVATLAKIFIVLTILLLGLFAFIFLGIAAFETDSTFSTVINAMLPIAATVGVGGGAVANEKDIAMKAEAFVHKVLNLLKSAV